MKFETITVNVVTIRDLNEALTTFLRKHLILPDSYGYHYFSNENVEMIDGLVVPVVLQVKPVNSEFEPSQIYGQLQRFLNQMCYENLIPKGVYRIVD